MLQKLSVGLARECVEKNNPDKHQCHVGYYLIGDGLPVTEKVLKANYSFAILLKQFISRNVSKLYVFESVLLTALVSAFLLSKLYHEDISTGIHIFFVIAKHFSCKSFFNCCY